MRMRSFFRILSNVGLVGAPANIGVERRKDESAVGEGVLVCARACVVGSRDGLDGGIEEESVFEVVDFCGGVGDEEHFDDVDAGGGFGVGKLRNPFVGGLA